MEAVYTAATASLAALEVLVNFSVLPHGYVLTEIRIPPGVGIESVRIEDLPDDWQSSIPTSATREFGAIWAFERRTAVLSVPSSVIPIERNFVINPLHLDFPKIHFLPSSPFRFDARLK